MFSEHGGGWFGPRFGFMDGFRGSRVQRGDMAPLILSVLKEKPMHGYEIIRTLEERSHGFWRPSAGSVYPTLQLLEEQGHVIGELRDGKKTYALTESGRAQADDKGCDPWHGRHHMGEHFRDLGPLVKDVMHAFKRAVMSGDEHTLAEAKRILTETAERLSKLSEEKNHTHE